MKIELKEGTVSVTLTRSQQHGVWTASICADDLLSAEFKRSSTEVNTAIGRTINCVAQFHEIAARLLRTAQKMAEAQELPAPGGVSG